MSKWRAHDPLHEEEIRTCSCGWSGFIEGGSCLNCAMPLPGKVLRRREQPMSNAYDYQQEFMARRAARRTRRTDG